ncbi:MAG: hypothetical protein QM764_18230 [Chitinophagaceae bacterium]
MNEQQELIVSVNNDFPVNLEQDTGREELRHVLANHINDLIVNHFNQLINLLYRLDVSEKKLQQWLLENTTEDTGIIIADLIIERQLQKIKSRHEFEGRNDAIDENEKW